MPNTTDLIVSWIDIRDVVPHAFNPRPWSDEHFARVHADHVLELAALIDQNGFAVNEAIVVRPIKLGRYIEQLEEHGFPVRPDLNGRDDGETVYEIPIGNHRYAAARHLGYEKVPCFIDEEMTDEKSLFAVVNRQGRTPELWYKAQHAYECCHHGYGRNGSLTQAAYGELMAVAQPVVAQYIAAYRVKLKISGAIEECPIPVKVARQIARLPEEDWDWFTRTMLAADWKEPQRKYAIAAVLQIEIPEHFQDWLPPLEWKKEAAAEAAQFYTSEISSIRAGMVMQWVKTAQQCLDGDKLSAERQVWIFEGDRPRLTIRNLREEFLKRLKTSNADSEARIRGVMAGLLAECREADEKYDRWQQARLDEATQRQIQEEQIRTRLSMEIEYAPRGERSWEDLLNSTDPDSFDAIAFWYPKLPGTEYDYPWMVDAVDLLKPGGAVVCICEEDEIFEFRQHITRSQLASLERILWLEPDKRRFYDICVAVKAGGFPPEPDRDRLLSENLLEKIEDLGVVLHGNPSPNGAFDSEDLAKYLLLRYVPRGGNLLNLFAGHKAPFAIAAKNLGFRSTFLELDSREFDLASSRIESAKFEWERND